MFVILLVDDEIVENDPGDFDFEETDDEGKSQGLLGYYVRELEQRDIKVVKATGACQALDMLKSGEYRFDLVILDIMMPYEEEGVFDGEATAHGVQTGFVLAKEINNLNPDIDIWVLSQVAPTEETPVNEGTVKHLSEKGLIDQVYSKQKTDSTDFTDDVLAFLKGKNVK